MQRSSRPWNWQISGPGNVPLRALTWTTMTDPVMSWSVGARARELSAGTCGTHAVAHDRFRVTGGSRPVIASGTDHASGAADLDHRIATRHSPAGSHASQFLRVKESAELDDHSRHPDVR